MAGADEVRGLSSANGDGSMSDDFQALCFQAFLAPVFALASRPQRQDYEIGRASCRERV